MKTFLFDTFNKYKRFSESLDIETILCNKTWFVFNSSGEREIYIFQENGKLKISLNGKVTHATWEYIPANKSLIISGNEQSYMVHAVYVDNILFTLQIDGTKEYAFLIDENNKQNFQPQSYNDIKQYFQIREQEFERLESKRLSVQEREEKKVQEKRIETELRHRAEDIAYPDLYFVICGIISVILGIIIAIITFPSFPSFSDFLELIFNTVTSSCLIFLLGGLIIYLIGNKRAKRWKKKHPNDPVNQHL